MVVETYRLICIPVKGKRGLVVEEDKEVDRNDKSYNLHAGRAC